MTFYPPSYRAAASDLTVAVSPLGLVELADEEFEVHGPRLNRYASNWAWYLGHHWAYRRELGESQLTFNYVKAFADYINNFTFGKGVEFTSPEATSAIVPHLLKRVWTEDNDRMNILHEIGQLGGVSGDVFVKVAYEEPFVDAIGRMHNGRVRILPLNPAFCFPEWHPHDRTRMIRFKLKYKFWGTAADGARQVFTYTEIITDDAIEEYVNDERIDSRPNPFGTIPIAYTQNLPIASSPWGLGDITDIVPLNREFNEKANEISDIINYHGSPVTVIIGAKASNLEKGPKKVWAIGTKDAKIQNLEMETNFAGILGYMELLKQSMHEMTGVPASALGTMQPISNTSGVALTVQYLSLMQRYGLKKIQYSRLFQRINELVMLHLVIKEPNSLIFNELITAVMPDPTQYLELDPNDPLTYESIISWPDPMPMDVLLKLNEIQVKMQLGLESKAGALRELGEVFPEEKLREIYEEMMEDMKEQAALSLLQAQSAQFIIAATGMTPDGQPLVVPGQAGPVGEDGQPGEMVPAVDQNLALQIMDRAYGQAPPQRNDFNG
jgi:hypothetical protein